jgi:hypothetical protein
LNEILLEFKHGAPGADWGTFNANITVEPAHGAALGWGTYCQHLCCDSTFILTLAIVSGINSVMGTLSPMILNQPDIAVRFVVVENYLMFNARLGCIAVCEKTKRRRMAARSVHGHHQGV